LADFRIDFMAAPSSKDIHS
jgi:hypothetical protein